MRETRRERRDQEAPISAPELQTVEANGLTIAYREAGAGPAVLLLHGWPTHSWLWREVMPPIARNNRVIAIDLPGFGASSKPLGHRYGFGFYDETLSAFLDRLGVGAVALGVHDLGGPIGLHWAVSNPERVSAVALLNTLVYPQVSSMVKLFVLVCSLPLTRSLITSPAGIAASMRFGVADRANMDDAKVRRYQEPFVSRGARRALADTAGGLGPRGFELIGSRLPGLGIPMRAIYGVADRVLPDVAETMARVERDVGGCEVTALEGVGHFLQEERGAEIGAALAPFFVSAASGGGEGSHGSGLR